MRSNGNHQASLLARGIHERTGREFIHDSEVREGNTANGYSFAAYLAARGLVDSQEARRAWRAGR